MGVELSSIDGDERLWRRPRVDIQMEVFREL